MKNWQKMGFGLLVLVFLLTLSLNKVQGRNPRDRERPERFTTGQILVKFQPGTSAERIRETHRENETFVEGEIEDLGVQVVNVPRGRERDKIAAYTRNPNVEFAELDYVAEALNIPNDFYFNNQWGMDNLNDTDVDAPEAWDKTTGNSTIKIAILDTGIDQDHEDFAGKITANVNFSSSGTVDDRYGHGTHVAGIAAAATNNSLGVAGIGYESSLMNVKVLNDGAWGNYSWIAKGITWAADNGAKVINLSLGGNQPSKTLQKAVDYAWSRGVVLACAAGNTPDTSFTYPAAYENCLAVAATDETDSKAWFSSYGNWVDVAAPGVNIFSTFPNAPYTIGKNLNYDYGSGTSMSTPHVSGIAALVWATSLGTSNQAVRDRIEQTADAIPGTGSFWTWGRVNACNAVGGGCSELSPTPTPMPTPTPTPTPRKRRR